MSRIVLAADLGGTNLRMAAVNDRGEILYRQKYQTPKSDRADEVLQVIIKSAEQCIEAIKDSGDILAVAAAVPATINSNDGIISKAPNIPALDGFRFSAALSSELNLPVILENDANSAAVGEHWLGASKGCQNSICITLGTGVGGGVIVFDKILRGIDGTAGEIGHICVQPHGTPCGCGSRGCVEQYSSATAMVRLVRDLGNKYPKSALQNKPHCTALDIYEAGKNGDALALEVFRQMGTYLGIALAGLVNVLNPEVIVIGGGASAGWDLFVNHVQEQIHQRAFHEPAARAKLVRAELGDDAGILGVAHLAFERLKTL